MIGLVENTQVSFLQILRKKAVVFYNRFFIEIMTEKQIIELLKTIKYPGFNRDIVSFGMVKEIKIFENKIQIFLNISSQNEEKKQKIIAAVKKLLLTKVENLEIKLSEDKVPPVQTQNQNDIKKLDNVKNIIAVASGKGGVGKSTMA